MADITEGFMRAMVNEGTGGRAYVDTGLLAFTFTSGVAARTGDIVSITGSGNTTITVPTGAKLFAMLMAATVTTCSLRGVAGDTGVTLDFTDQIPVLLPLASTSTIVINKSNAGDVNAQIWFG